MSKQDAEILGIIIGAIIVLVTVFGSFVFKSYECESKWTSYQHRWSLIGGCQVEVNGVWTPAENVRAF